MQFIHSLVKRSLNSGFIAGHTRESIVESDIFPKDVGVKVMGVGVLVFFGERFAPIDGCELEEGGFHALEALDAPGVDDHLLEQKTFGGAAGLILGFE